MTSNLPRLAGIALSGGLFGIGAAQAQDLWQEYRRNDLGFRVEMPGQPAINQEKRDEHNYGFHVDVVLNGATLFSAQYIESDTDSEEAMFTNVRAGFAMVAKLNHVEITNKSISIDGLRGEEFILPEVQGRGMIVREFSLNKKAFVILDAEGVGVSPDNPDVRRFLDSFALLPK